MNKRIVISPYSNKLRNGQKNPKNYPYWNQLITLLHANNFDIIQIGITGEDKLKNVDSYMFNLSFKEICTLIDNSSMWISVDNFLPHMINCEKINTKGLVLFSRSDPKLFGYPQNINVLKSRNYLRPDQFFIWEQCPYDKNAYIPVISVMNKINDYFKNIE